MALGLALRINYLIVNNVQPRDAYKYERFIIEWNKTGEAQAGYNFPPFSVFLLKKPNDIWGVGIIKGGVTLNMIIGIYIIFLTIIISEKIIANNLTRIIAGFLVATNIQLIKYSCSFLRENIYLFLYLLIIYCGIKYYKSKARGVLAALGVLSALCMMTRYEAGEIILYFFFFLILIALNNKSKIKSNVIFLLKEMTVYSAMYCLTLVLVSSIMNISSNYYLSSILRQLNKIR